MRSLMALTLVVAAFGAGSCTYRNETINRVVDPYWRKSDFSPDNQWYLRTTVVDAPPENGWISIADGDWLMLERMRWEVTETMLIGWRDYATVPGTELDTYPGTDDHFKGQPIAMFTITDHFDVKQSFDSGTGELGNEIVENRDRLWFDRAFMRVDWSVNRVQSWQFHVLLQQFFDSNPVLQNDAADPKRWRFETDANGNLDYFEVTTRTNVIPDFSSWYYAPYAFEASGAIIDMRHSFMRVPPSDYEPLPMPPSVVLEDADGNEVRDADGFAVRVPINDRFAFFGTLGRATFDENRGIVSSGQVFNASRFNIWKKHKNPDGTIIPTDQREPKPIIYYTNVEHPESLQSASQRVGSEWNRVFRSMMKELQPTKFTGAPDADGIPSDVPEMFIVRRNDCNFENVGRVLNALPEELRAQVTASSVRESYNPSVVGFDGTFADAERRFLAAQERDFGTFTERQSAETQALHDLERICAALEYYTAADITLGRPAPTLEDGTPIVPFKYQRLGDVRYSMLNLIVGHFQSGWLGLGPPYADPITGETISATANMSMSILDERASVAAHFVQALNGDLAGTELGFGLDVQRYMKSKLLENNTLSSFRPDPRAREEMSVYFNALKERGRGDVLMNAVGETSPGRAESRMERVAGTNLEQNLITPDDVVLFGRADPAAAQSGAVLDDALMDSVSPARGRDLVKDIERHQEHIIRMGNRAMCAPELIDDLLIGRAIQLRDLPYDELFLKLREEIYAGVQMHEVGHNMGLFHNMAASADALNYGKQFWELQQLDADMATALVELEGNTDPVSIERAQTLQGCIDLVAEIGGTATSQLDPAAADMTTQDCLGQSEGMYSSVMDYHAKWNGRFNGLGLYDEAAIKFGYGQLLEVFNPDVMAPNPNPERNIKRRIFLDGWQTIPGGIVTDHNAIHDRQYVKMEWNTSSTRQAPLANEVPYKWGYGAMTTPDDKPFDFGPDFSTNAKNELTRYFQNYFFTHFSRDQLVDFYDGAIGAIGADLGPLNDFTQKMRWFFFFEATDPDFAGSYAEQDLLATTITGLNLFGQVLGHPSNGLQVSALKSDVFGLLDEPPEGRTLTASDIAIPWSALGECSARKVADVGSTISNGCASDDECAAVCPPSSEGCTCDLSFIGGACVDRSNDGDGVFVEALPGFNGAFVPPSEGRPFFLGLTDDYEEWYVTYVGTYWTKSSALSLLLNEYARFPRIDGQADPRVYSVSWYRLFPEQVRKLYWAIITDHAADIGPTIDPEGNYVARELVSPDLTEPDYTGNTRILPSMSFNHQYLALYYANGWNTEYDDTFDLPKTMRVALQGGNDDESSFDVAIANAVANGDDPASVVATFTHPVSGLTLRGLKVGNYPIAYDLINRLNVFKERFVRLDDCVASMDSGGTLHIDDEYCHCVTVDTDPLTGDCQQMIIEQVGSGTCQEYSLRNRRDSAREIMDDLVDYVGDLRTFNKIFGWY